MLASIASSVVLVAAALGAAPASAATISSGHVDVLDIDYEGTTLSLNIRDSRTSTVADDVSPAATTFAVVPSTLTTVPSGSGYGCLGTAGSPVYLLPQSNVSGVLWPGWNTEGIPSNALQNNNVTLRLDSWTIPSGARFALYTTSLSGPTFRLNTNSTTGCPRTTWTLPRNTHGHGWWAFTKAGTYTLKFRATATTSGGVAKDTGLVTYTFVVG
ncbi:MAG: choice-of-anchor M domain-containing protein [Actinomycetales bacterium]